MRRPLAVLLALAALSTLAAAPGAAPRDSSVGVATADGTFPIGVCAWARPVSDDDVCVTVNDPRPWLP